MAAVNYITVWNNGLAQVVNNQQQASSDVGDMSTNLKSASDSCTAEGLSDRIRFKSVNTRLDVYVVEKGWRWSCVCEHIVRRYNVTEYLTVRTRVPKGTKNE